MRSTAASPTRTSSTAAARTRCCSSCSRTPGSARRYAPQNDHDAVRQCERSCRGHAEPDGLMTLASTYARYPVEFVSGSGCVLHDADGHEYLDFLSGIAVNNVGH